MVISNSHKFGVAWGVIERSRVPTFFYGWVILIINEKVYPSHMRFNHTIDVVFRNMQSTFTQINSHFLKEDYKQDELGDRAMTLQDIESGDINGLYHIGLGDLESCYENDIVDTISFSMDIGFHGSEERLFFSDDGYKTLSEVRFPRGTVEKVIMALPNKPEDFVLVKRNRTLSFETVQIQRAINRH